MKNHVLRLEPGQDLKTELTKFCKAHNIHAGFILSGIGSLKTLKLRLANSKTYLEKAEFFEILSLQGSLSLDGAHVHMAVSDSQGHCWGGHLTDGCEIYTTAEILVQELEGYKFERAHDERTGFKELKVSRS